MTFEEMCDFASMLVDDARFDEFVPTYVELAKDRMLTHLFPFAKNATWDDVPVKYHARTCEIAVYLVNRRGAEGEASHSENGVSHVYESAGIPASFFAGITPFAGVPECDA